MTNLLSKIFSTLFDLEHILTPIAVDKYQRSRGSRVLSETKVLYIFGVRVASWRIDQ